MRLSAAVSTHFPLKPRIAIVGAAVPRLELLHALLHALVAGRKKRKAR
jgi:hypothetical protein